MDPIAIATRNLLQPAYLGWFHPAQLRHSRLLAVSERWPEERVREEQWRALRGVVAWVYRHNRYYRRRMAELGAEPGDVRSPADYRRLPMLTKQDLREHLSELISDGFDPSTLERRRTGGSSGVPVQLFWDREASRAKAAITARHDAWAGFRVGEKKAALWGDVKRATTLWGKLKEALHTRTIFLDTLEMDEARLLEFVEAVRRTRTRLLFGHGHSVYHLACFVRDRGIPGLRLDAIISSAEMLPPEERRVVEAVFGNVVFDRYGCEEVGLIASECAEHDGMHVAAEGLYVEILDGTEREPGRVVVTDLLNHGTPLLRYEIGDLATTRSGACACGRGLPRIGKVTGRTSDVLYGPEGKQVSGISLLDTVTIHIPGFRQVQVVQERLDELTFRVVRDGAVSEASLAMLRGAVAKYFGPSMRHTVVFVDRIPLTGRGKFQYSICRIDAAGRPR